MSATYSPTRGNTRSRAERPIASTCGCTTKTSVKFTYKFMPEKTEKIELNHLEKTILQSAVKKQMVELEKVGKKAQTLGVDTTRAVERDINVLKDLETKLL